MVRKLIRLRLIIKPVGYVNGSIEIGQDVLSKNIGMYSTMQVVPDSWKAQVD